MTPFLSPLFAQADPAGIAQGISQHGLAYILAAVTVICGTTIGYLYRALIASKDRLIEEKEKHTQHVEVLLKGQLEMASQQTEVMEKIYAALDRQTRYSGAPSDAHR